VLVERRERLVVRRLGLAALLLLPRMQRQQVVLAVA
jgi:hypothetical protein